MQIICVPGACSNDYNPFLNILSQSSAKIRNIISSSMRGVKWELAYLTHNLISFKLNHITFLIITPAQDAHHLVLLSNMEKGWLYPRHCPSLFTMQKEMVLREQSPTWNSIREYRITSSYNHTKAHHSLIGIKWSMTDTLHDFRHHTDLFLAVYTYIYMCLPADTHCTACS